jgi:hypothetical protein
MASGPRSAAGPAESDVEEPPRLSRVRERRGAEVGNDDMVKLIPEYYWCAA